ncbi:Hypothetical predicted protein, partial [Marmota monax]
GLTGGQPGQSVQDAPSSAVPGLKGGRALGPGPSPGGQCGENLALALLLAFQSPS